MTTETAAETAAPPAHAPAPAAPDADDGVVVRRVETLAEYHACVAIERETWGPDFSECVPATILMVSQKLGGVVAGAFGPDGAMLGFVFGMAGVIDGRLAHWSDMLAVRPAARGARVGERLKHCQRELARAAGAEAMYWTFDPLVARNAHLNLTRLGARVVEYVPNMYGDGTSTPLHGGVPTDRLVARWDLTAPAGAGTGARPALDGAPPAARIPVPRDFLDLAPDARAEWRARTREAFVDLLGRGYRVTGFRRAADGDGLPYYEFATSTPHEAPR